MATAREDVAHLLRRAGFGGLPGEIDALAGMDLPAIVDRLLDGARQPEVVAPAVLADTGLDWWEQVVPTQTWWIERMRTTPSPLHEKMTLFWHGHFANSVEKVGSMVAAFAQNQLFRKMGLGSFRALSQAVAVDPSMLVYLDNHRNTVGAQNENFAREYMELFSLGVNQYTQDDVVAAARAWTGHGLNSARTAYVFNATKHDMKDKTFFGVTRNWDGPEIVNEICTGAKKPIVARFIAKKLWSFFAYPNPEAAVLDELTSVFMASNDLDIATLVRAIFLHPRFYSATARTGLVRTPTEFVVAALRYTGVGTATANPEWYASTMGQQLFYPPNVSGWRDNAYWLTTAGTGARANFARNLTWKAVEAGVLAGTSKSSVAAAVQRAFDQFGLTAPSPSTRSALERWLTAERSARGWAEQHNLITLTLLSPDFQLA